MTSLHESIRRPDRAYLHAYQIEFRLQEKPYQFQVIPTTGFWFQSESFVTAMENYRHPEQLDWPKTSKR